MTTLGVVAQVTTALRPKNRLAAALGALLGGFVPVASYVLAHRETDVTAPLWTQVAPWFVVGGLAYSAVTVYQWAARAVGNPIKAAGFVLLVEGVMVASRTEWLGLVALAYLVAINAVATGCTLALEHRGRTRARPAVRRRTPAQSSARLRAA